MIWLKENWVKLLLGILVVGGIATYGYFDEVKQNLSHQSTINPIPTTSPADKEEPLNTLSDDEVKYQLNDILLALQTLHYVSISEPGDAYSETPILDSLTEAMYDRNKMQNLIAKIDPLTKSGNKIIATTAMAIGAGNLELIKIHDSWIEYLRSVNQYNVDLAEFQYQIALFQSSSHDVYLKLIESSSLLPMVAVEFTEDESDQNLINQNIKSYFVTRIDELFSDIFSDNEKFYRETKNKYAIAVLVQGYKDFYTK